MLLFVEALKFSKNVMLHPGEETKRIPNDYKELFTYLIFISIFYSVLSLALSLIIFYTSPESLAVLSSLGGILPPIFPGLQGLLLSAVLLPIGIIAGTVLGSALIHGIGKALRIYQRPFLNTITPYAYGIAPIAIIGWIPGVSIVAGIWSFIVILFALSNHQGITKAKALVSVAIPVFVILFLATYVFDISDFYMAGSLSGLFPNMQLANSNSVAAESIPRVIIDFGESKCYSDERAIAIVLRNVGTNPVDEDFVLSFGSQQISKRLSISAGSLGDIFINALEYNLDVASGTRHEFVLHAASFPGLQLSRANIVC